MQASAVMTGVAEVLQDIGNLTWTSDQLLNWLNDAQRQVVNVRPDASATTGNVTCVVGTEQSIPTGGERFIKAVCNMGADGNTPGRAIRPADWAALDENNPDWHSDTPVAAVKGWVFDPSAPKTFWLTPPIIASQQVKIIYSAAPTDCATSSSDIDLPDIYAPAMTEWMLYRAFSRDSPETANGQRARTHFQNFFDMLGVKVTADAAVARSVPQRLAAG